MKDRYISFIFLHNRKTRGAFAGSPHPHPVTGAFLLSMDRPAFLTPAALERWIPELKQADRMYMFYKTPEWRSLRQQVLEANHYECEDCRAKSPTKINRAVTVHHVMPVEKYPGLALSTAYVDAHGRLQRQLVALCDDCHNARHHRFGHTEQTDADAEPLTPERW